MENEQMNIAIRKEEPGDAAPIRRVLGEAFGQPLEANMVDALRIRDAAALSMVAVLDGEVVGHILFTPVYLEPEIEGLKAVGLGPMAVLPLHQKMGIGSQMVREALGLLTDAAYHFAVVLGHADYYPRFGFIPASPLGIRCEFDVPEELFMVMELREGALDGLSGLVRYLPEFREV